MQTYVHFHCPGSFNTLNRLPSFKDTYVNRCTLTLKRTLWKAPEYLKSMFQMNSDVHCWNTPFSKLNIRCTIYNNSTEGGRGTSTVRSIKDWWNNWKKVLKNSENTRSFKMKLKDSSRNREEERGGVRYIMLLTVICTFILVFYNISSVSFWFFFFTS